MNVKFFIGPMSLNIVDTVIKFSEENNIKIGLIPSRRQVEKTGGYVNNWTTKDFCDYVRSKTSNIILVRDHCGPNQGISEDDGIESFTNDCKYVDVIHIDVWKKYPSYQDGLRETIKFINLGYSINPNILYEIGTEESIRKFESYELKNLVDDLKLNLKPDVFSKIKYLVVQSGTALKENRNIGKYDSSRLSEMINLSKKYELISKEHNGDYIENDVLKEKFSLGLNSINIAPEFGQIETKVILEEIEILKRTDLFDNFFELCLNSKKWIKWVPENYNPYFDKESLINICGHYLFSNSDFLKIKSQLGLDIDLKIQSKIYNRIQEIYYLTK